MFYKNKEGKAAREVQDGVLRQLRAAGWNPAEQDKLDQPVLKDE